MRTHTVWQAVVAGSRPGRNGSGWTRRWWHRAVIAVTALLCVSPSTPVDRGSSAGSDVLASRLSTLQAGSGPRHRPASPRVFRPVPTHRPRIRVSPVPLEGAAQARAVPGVVSATVVQVGPVTLDAGRRDTVRVAAVAPDEFRRFTPQISANRIRMWKQVAAGAAAVTHEAAQRLGLRAGARAGVDNGRGSLPVGAVATNTLPPIADVVVARVTGRRLGVVDAPGTLLVGIDDRASPRQVAARLEQRLGGTATVIDHSRRPRRVVRSGEESGGTVWDRLALCESSGRWHLNTGNGFYGGLQFLPESWYLVGGTGLPHLASRAEQIRRAEMLYEIQGWAAWPVCSVLLGLRPAPPGFDRMMARGQPSPSPAPSPTGSRPTAEDRNRQDRQSHPRRSSGPTEQPPASPTSSPSTLPGVPPPDLGVVP